MMNHRESTTARLLSGLGFAGGLLACVVSAHAQQTTWTPLDAEVERVEVGQIDITRFAPLPVPRWIATLDEQALVVAWVDAADRRHLVQFDPVTLAVVERASWVDRPVQSMTLTQDADEVVVLWMGRDWLSTARLAADPARRQGPHLLDTDLGYVGRNAVGLEEDGACAYVYSLHEHTDRFHRFPLDETLAPIEGPVDNVLGTAAMRGFDPADCDASVPTPETVDNTTPTDLAASESIAYAPRCTTLGGTEFCLVAEKSSSRSHGEDMLWLERRGRAPSTVLSPVPPLLGEPPRGVPERAPLVSTTHESFREIHDRLEDWCEARGDIGHCRRWTTLTDTRVVPAPVPNSGFELEMVGGRVAVAISDTGEPTFELREEAPFLCPVDVDLEALTGSDDSEGSTRARRMATSLLTDCLDHSVLPTDFASRRKLHIKLLDGIVRVTLERDGDTWRLTAYEEHALAEDSPVLAELVTALHEELGCDDLTEAESAPRGCEANVSTIEQPLDARDVERGRVEVSFDAFCMSLRVHFRRKKGRWRVDQLHDVTGSCAG